MQVLWDAARRVIENALASSDSRACLTCSFQLEDMVVLHMARSLEPRLPVLFLDTGYHFGEVCAYRDQMALSWNLNLINIRPALSVSEQEARFGLLYRTEPDRCCRMRKVEPLMSALQGYDVWLTGLRREQSPTRANLQVEEFQSLPSGKKIRKVNPLAEWTWAQVHEYAEAHGIPPLPLYSQGYTSIGCAPCTSLPSDPNDPRSGRWGGRKLECGIHTFVQGA
ncbi:MAG: phosphoadenylyl-sulfate reductase [Bryobacterales bacterium]|nr:phosphoadenylyl-sulfate reductase [Bryobacteraceae bacterium]MDW8129884.1 phosphoadenylyl-sulfate reductase [Bryobacterales bacterium]